MKTSRTSRRWAGHLITIRRGWLMTFTATKGGRVSAGWTTYAPVTICDGKTVKRGPERICGVSASIGPWGVCVALWPRMTGCGPAAGH